MISNMVVSLKKLMIAGLHPELMVRVITGKLHEIVSNGYSLFVMSYFYVTFFFEYKVS